MHTRASDVKQKKEQAKKIKRKQKKLDVNQKKEQNLEY